VQGTQLRVLRLILTAFFSLFTVIGIGAFIMGKIPFYSLIMAIAYLCVAAALNKKGGNVTRIIAYIVSGIFMVCGLLFIALVVSTFFNNAYDYLTPIVLAVFGVVGISTFTCLRKLAL
jgi:hypothetical protein